MWPRLLKYHPDMPVKMQLRLKHSGALSFLFSYSLDHSGNWNMLTKI